MLPFNLILEEVELRLAALAKREESHAHPLPISGLHPKRLPGGDEMPAVGAIGEPVAVGDSIEGDAQP